MRQRTCILTMRVSVQRLSDDQVLRFQAMDQTAAIMPNTCQMMLVLVDTVLHPRTVPRLPSPEPSSELQTPHTSDGRAQKRARAHSPCANNRDQSTQQRCTEQRATGLQYSTNGHSKQFLHTFPEQAVDAHGEQTSPPLLFEHSLGQDQGYGQWNTQECANLEELLSDPDIEALLGDSADDGQSLVDLNSAAAAVCPLFTEMLADLEETNDDPAAHHDGSIAGEGFALDHQVSARPTVWAFKPLHGQVPLPSILDCFHMPDCIVRMLPEPNAHLGLQLAAQ